MGGLCSEMKRTEFRWRKVITWKTKVLAGRLVSKFVSKETGMKVKGWLHVDQ